MTTQDLINELRARRRICLSKQIQHQVLFPALQFRSLNRAENLYTSGVHNLSTLHVRTLLPGGSKRNSGAMRHDFSLAYGCELKKIFIEDLISDTMGGSATRFSGRSGRFYAKRPKRLFRVIS